MADLNHHSKAKILCIMQLIDELSPAEKDFMILVGKIAKEKGNSEAAKLFER